MTALSAGLRPSKSPPSLDLIAGAVLAAEIKANRGFGMVIAVICATASGPAIFDAALYPGALPQPTIGQAEHLSVAPYTLGIHWTGATLRSVDPVRERPCLSRAGKSPRTRPLQAPVASTTLPGLTLEAVVNNLFDHCAGSPHLVHHRG